MTPLPDSPAGSELHRPVSIDGMGKSGRQLHILAEPREREGLARELDLVSLDRLEADIQVAPAGKRHLFRLTATFEADVVQTCVVTLEPVASTIRATVERLYTTEIPEESEESATTGPVDLEPDAVDPPDPIVGETIDVGAAVAEQLALEIDPFPRAAGANFAGYSSHPDLDEPANPFAALAKLKEGQSGRGR